MTTQVIYLTGKAKWCKHTKPDPKYNNYSVDLYMDEKSFVKFAESGAQLTIRDGEEGRYVTIKRPHTKLIKGKAETMGPPETLDNNNDPFKGNIGNGSDVTIKLSVYDTAKGKGTRWDAIRVDNLVEYAGTKVDTDINMPF